MANDYTIAALVDELNERQAFREVMNNPLSQWGTPERPYLGATILPEQTTELNEYTEDQVTYRTVIANDGTRYSPVQLKQSAKFGTVRVTLGHQDIGSQLTAKDYDTLQRMLKRARAGGLGTMDSMTRVLNWTELTLLRPLRDKMEKQRWEAIVDASVVIRGDNNYLDTFEYPKPTGHRVAAAGDWDSDAYDPYDDIKAGINFLEGKGYTTKRIITSTTVKGKMLANDKITGRIFRFISGSGGVVTRAPIRAAWEDVQSLNREEDIPPFEIYDRKYNTQSSSGYYLKRNVMVLIGETERVTEVNDPNNDTAPIPVPNTLGYHAVGVAQGEDAPGRIVHVRSIANTKPYRIEGEAWQAALPVILDPEAIYVITTID